MVTPGFLTVVVSVAELSPVSGSNVLELIEAVFEILVPSATAAPTLTTSVKSAEPTPKLGFVQPIAPVPPTAGVVPQVQPTGGVIDLNVVFVGTVSDKAALEAVSSPPLVTVIV